MALQEWLYNMHMQSSIETSGFVHGSVKAQSVMLMVLSNQEMASPLCMLSKLPNMQPPRVHSQWGFDHETLHNLLLYTYPVQASVLLDHYKLLWL